MSVSPGDNVLCFDVPSWAADGTTYARFRLSTAGGLLPTGLADDGEVEDYQLTIHFSCRQPPRLLQPLRLGRQQRGGQCG